MAPQQRRHHPSDEHSDEPNSIQEWAMNYAVELFDGQQVDWFMVEKTKVTELFDRIENAELGEDAMILGIMTEQAYLDQQEMEPFYLSE
ncbi:MAG: hypothetical protein HQL50_09850 [Magnetococcales bacterium]|nr:hypothetical protein [Magnetococcales bacterium]